MDLLEAALPVLELASRLAAHDCDAGRDMDHAHGRVCRVHALTTGARGMERLSMALAGKLLVRKACKARILLMAQMSFYAHAPLLSLRRSSVLDDTRVHLHAAENRKNVAFLQHVCRQQGHVGNGHIQTSDKC